MSLPLALESTLGEIYSVWKIEEYAAITYFILAELPISLVTACTLACFQRKYCDAAIVKESDDGPRKICLLLSRLNIDGAKELIPSKKQLYFVKRTKQETCTNESMSRFGIGLQNVALQKRTNQSSTYDSHLSGNAVDNVINTHHRYCTHTNSELNPWWQVDLEDQYYIFSVSLTNRGDCCPERLNNFDIRISNSPMVQSKYTVCAYQMEPMTASEHKTLVCTPEPIYGRFVVVIIKSTGTLTLCNVEVWAC